jgi:hypothetical protein
MGIGIECMALGCPKEARWQIGFRIWPVGVLNRHARNAVEGLTGKCVCDEHAVRDLDKFFTAKAKRQMEIGFLNAGRGMPDFSTAQVVHTEITEGEPITAEEAQSLGGFPDMPG